MKRMLLHMLIPVVLAAVTISLAGCSSMNAETVAAARLEESTAASGNGESEGMVYPVVPPDADRGKLIYQDKCLSCHGIHGRGNGAQAAELPNPVPALGTLEVSHAESPQDWYAMITKGNIQRYMPSFTSLSERQRWDVIAYLYSLGNSAELPDKGKTLYRKNCAECHGKAGEGNIAGATAFTDLRKMTGLSADDLISVIANGRGNMPSFGNLDEEAYQALGVYLRTFTFPLPIEGAQNTGGTAPQGSQVMSSTTAETETLQTSGNPAGESPMISTTNRLSTTLDASPVISGTRIAETAIEEPGQSVTGTVRIVIQHSPEITQTTGMQVVLNGFDDLKPVYTTTVSIPQGGEADLPAVPMTAGRVFYATTKFDGTTYGSNIFVVKTLPVTPTLTLRVYKTTTDVSALSVDRLHVFFDFLEPGKIQVIELYVISNNSGRTVVAENPGDPVVNFVLPDDASNLRFWDGALGKRYVMTETGFGDTIGVTPDSDSHQVLFAFDMPYDENKLDLKQALLLKTAAVIVMAPEDGVEIKSDQLEYSGARNVEGVSYSMYTSDPMEIGDVLALTVSGEPHNTGSKMPEMSGNKLLNIVIGMIALGIALIAAGLFLNRRRKSNDEYSEDEDVSADEEPVRQADAIMDAIIALDNLYQQGDLPEKAYLQRRSELKEQLRKALEQKDAGT